MKLTMWHLRLQLFQDSAILVTSLYLERKWLNIAQSTKTLLNKAEERIKTINKSMKMKNSSLLILNLKHMSALILAVLLTWVVKNRDSYLQKSIEKILTMSQKWVRQQIQSQWSCHVKIRRHRASKLILTFILMLSMKQVTEHSDYSDLRVFQHQQEFFSIWKKSQVKNNHRLRNYSTDISNLNLPTSISF